jgi:hypothetical protein
MTNEQYKIEKKTCKLNSSFVQWMCKYYFQELQSLSSSLYIIHTCLHGNWLNEMHSTVKFIYSTSMISCLFSPVLHLQPHLQWVICTLKEIFSLQLFVIFDPLNKVCHWHQKLILKRSSSLLFGIFCSGVIMNIHVYSCYVH